MTVQSDAIALFRREWAARFIDTIAVERVTSRGTFNATTLAYDTPSDASVYSGAALLRPVQDVDLTQFGGQLDTATGILVFVPHDAATFDLEDTVGVVACALDPDLVGKELRVVAVTYDSYQTRQRLVCRLDLGAGYVD